MNVVETKCSVNVYFCSVWASMCVGEPHTGQYTQLGIFFFIHIHTYITALLCFSDESLVALAGRLPCQPRTIVLIYYSILELEQSWIPLSDCKAELVRLKHIKGEY